MQTPQKVKLHRSSRQLELEYSDATFHLDAEYLRVFSPSAEVKGHGPGQEVLQSGKQSVTITNIEPQGNYAIRISFDDGHNSGIYSWSYLYELGKHQQSNWDDYLDRLNKAGKHRDGAMSAVKIINP